MQARHGTALLFVTHDLGVVSKVCQSLTVLYAGMVVEDTGVRDFFARPAPSLFRAPCWPRRRNTPTPTASLMPVPEAVIARRAGRGGGSRPGGAHG